MAKILSKGSCKGQEVESSQVVEVFLDPTLGDEKGKTRPCLIVEAGASPLNLVIVLPITDAKGKENARTFVPIEDLKKAGLVKASVIDCYQIRTLDGVRIKKVLGEVSKDVMFQVRNRLANFLDIDEAHCFA
jgi:mRNA interferase MazF